MRIITKTPIIKLISRRVVSFFVTASFRLWHWYQQGARKKAFDSRGSHSLIDSNESLDFELSYKTEAAGRLRNLLCRYPYWYQGHLSLARLALQLDEVFLAYSSAQAAILLNPPEKELATAKRLLGTSFVRQGMYQQGIETLKEALSSHRDIVLIKEELIAAHLALDFKEEALEVLNSIPMNERSAEMVSVSNYLSKPN